MSKPYKEFLSPMTPMQAVVHTRMYATNDDGTVRPFSIRMWGRKRTAERVTVLGLHMGSPTEDPVLHTQPADKYLQLVELEPLRAALRSRLMALVDRIRYAPHEYLLELENELARIP